MRVAFTVMVGRQDRVAEDVTNARERDNTRLHRY
jgi:hypothetical protein